MRQFVMQVTVTGADDSVDVNRMVEISRSHPVVEWGILMSESGMGRKPRYPSAEWLHRLYVAKRENPFMRLSAHLCGRWVRDFCDGGHEFSVPVSSALVGGPGHAAAASTAIQDTFERVQLNFHDRAYAAPEKMAAAMRMFPRTHFILQMDGASYRLRDDLRGRGILVFGLFDLSGGAGILPSEWPESEDFQGYAGGLSPENVAEQLGAISARARGAIWIDAESRLRSEDDLELRMDRVLAYLDAAAPWCVAPARTAFVPGDLTPLSDAEFTALFQDAFDAMDRKRQTASFDALEFGTYQRLLLALSAERENVGRLRHWVASAGGNIKRPMAEATVMFMALDMAHDYLLGGDTKSAFPVLEKALFEVALSRAGKKDLDLAEWGAMEAARQAEKPQVRAIEAREKAARDADAAAADAMREAAKSKGEGGPEKPD